MKISHYTLKAIAKSKHHKMLEKVCEIKSKYKNSVIYKKTIKNPSGLGWSRTKLNTFIKWCIGQGWGEYHKGNFRIYSSQTINSYFGETYKRTVKVQNRNDIYYQLLKNRLRQKEFDDRKKADFNYSADSRKAKTAMKYLQKSGRSFPEGKQKFKINPGISLRTISGSLGVSVSITHGILKKMSEMGLIEVKRRWKNYGHYNQQSFSALSSLYNGIFKNKYNVILRYNTSIIYLKDIPSNVEGGTLVCN